MVSIYPFNFSAKQRSRTFPVIIDDFGDVIIDMVVHLLLTRGSSVKMTLSGLTGNPCCLRIPLHGLTTLSRRVPAFPTAEKPQDKVNLLGLERH